MAPASLWPHLAPALGPLCAAGWLLPANPGRPASPLLWAWLARSPVQLPEPAAPLPPLPGVRLLCAPAVPAAPAAPSQPPGWYRSEHCRQQAAAAPALQAAPGQLPLHAPPRAWPKQAAHGPTLAWSRCRLRLGAARWQAQRRALAGLAGPPLLVLALVLLLVLLLLPLCPAASPERQSWRHHPGRAVAPPPHTLPDTRPAAPPTGRPP